MIVAIDSRALMNPPAGVGNFLIAAVNYWAALKPSWRFYLLVNRDIHTACLHKLHQTPNIIILKRPFFIFPRIGILWFAFKLFFILNRIRPDYFWSPSGVLPPVMPGSVKILVTIHDLVPVRYRKTMMIVDRIYYRLFFKRSIRHADLLWAVSYYTRDQIKQYFPERKCSHIAVGQCFEKVIFRQEDSTSEDNTSPQVQYGINDNYLLYVGTIEPRKNLKFLVSLMKDLAGHGFSLLIVGAKGWGKSGIDDILQSDRKLLAQIRLAGYVSDRDLGRLYANAAALVIPSLNEGFGLPALEAMLCSCPVVAADHSGLHEVVKNGGVLVQGWGRAEWIRCILEAAGNREAYIKKGFSKSRQYNPVDVLKKISSRMTSGTMRTAA